MNLRIFGTFLAVSLLFVCDTTAQDSTLKSMHVAERETKIKDFVKAFNQLAAKHPTGKSQPALTTLEVLDALNRTVEPSDRFLADGLVPEKLIQACTRIVQSESVSKNIALRFRTIEFDGDKFYGAWNVTMDIGSYSVRIRSTQVPEASRKQVADANRSIRHLPIKRRQLDTTGG